MGGHLTRLGWPVQVVHDFDNYKSALSEGKALAVVVRAVPGIPHWKQVATDSPNPLGLSAARRRPRASSPLTARRRRRMGGGLPTICQELGTRFGWVAPSTGIHPCRKAEDPMRKPRPTHRRQAVCYAHETPTQAATIRTRCGSKPVPLCNMAQATFSSRSATERRASV